LLFRAINRTAASRRSGSTVGQMRVNCSSPTRLSVIVYRRSYRAALPVRTFAGGKAVPHRRPTVETAPTHRHSRRPRMTSRLRCASPWGRSL
jgi:hypothetical protein